jgi:hypothetical protein
MVCEAPIGAHNQSSAKAQRDDLRDSGTADGGATLVESKDAKKTSLSYTGRVPHGGRDRYEGGRAERQITVDHVQDATQRALVELLLVDNHERLEDYCVNGEGCAK